MGLADCEVQMPDVLEKAETASTQKCTVKGQGNGHKLQHRKFFLEIEEKMNGESD